VKARIKRLLREEEGFTLSELLVTMMIMIMVLFALYNIFDMSIRVFSFGNDKVEAVENARLGLEKMERELRAAYPINRAGNDSRLITSPISNPSNQSTFGNDLNNNRVANDTGEQITYRLSGGSPPALLRNDQPVIEYVAANGLSFRYLDEDGNETTDESRVARVRITLNIQIDRGSFGTRTQTLTTDVALRNRG
jgi:competence protein ComGC